MSKYGTCYVCGKTSNLIGKILSFDNVHCECCRIGYHQHKVNVCIDCIRNKITGPTKIYYTGSVHTVPMEVLAEHSDLSATDMKRFIKKEYNNNGI